MKKKKSLAQNLVVYALRIFVLSASPLFVFPYVSKVLGAQGVGEVQYAFSIASYFQLFSALGISSYGIREGTKCKNNPDAFSRFCSELVLINLISASCSSLVYLGLLFFAQSLIQYRALLLLFFFYVFFAGMTMDWFVSIQEDFTYVTVRTCIFQAFFLVMAFVCITSKEDTLIYAAVLSLPSVFSSIANGVYLKKNVVLFHNNGYNLKKHLRPILFLFAILISGNVYSLLDSTMLGILVNDTAVGLYKAASNYPRLVVQLVTSLCAVFLPRLTFYIAQQDQENFEQLFNKVGTVILWLTVPCVVGLWVLSPEIVMAFNGQEYISAAPAMRVLSINAIFSVIDGFLGWQVLVPLNKEKMLMLATSVGAGADVILNCILIPRYGVIGAAYATLFSELLVFAVCVASVSSSVPLGSVLRRAWKFVLAAVAILVARAVPAVIGLENPMLIICIVVVLSVMFYTGTLYLLRETLTCEGIGRVEKIVKKLIN